MSWFPDSIINRPPRADEMGLIVRPIFSGSDPGVLTVRLDSGSLGNLTLNMSGSTQAQPGTSVPFSVPYSTISSILAPGNASRLGMLVYNDSNRNLFLLLGPGATSTTFSVKMPPGAYFELPFPAYTGTVSGVWSPGGSGAARVTELTP